MEAILPFVLALEVTKHHAYLYSIYVDSHKPPPILSRENIDPPLKEESKSHIVRKVGGIKDLCCGHFEKYNLPYLSNRQKWSH